MGLRNRHRVFSLRYRKSANVIFREKECNFDRQPDDRHKVGDIWHDEQANSIWVNLAVEYFEHPSSKHDLERFDQVFGRCEAAAEQWLRTQYPGTRLESPKPS